MARCGIGLTNLWDGATISYWSQNAELPATNVATPLPGEAFEQAEGQDGSGFFEVRSGVNDTVWINEGSGVVGVTITSGAFTAATMAARIEADLNASGSLSYTYSVGYTTATRKFGISSISGNFSLPNSSAPTQNLLYLSLGFDAPDSGTSAYIADYERSSTVTQIRFATSSGILPNLIGLMLDSTGGTDTDASTLYGTVHVYAHTSDLGNLEANWISSASLELAVSDRPSNTENTLQVAVTSNATAYAYWAVFWRHVDDHEYHRIQIARAVSMVSSDDRSCREVGDHNLFNRTQARTLENQHPVKLKSEWRMTIELERWEATDYRAFKVAADRYGKDDGIFFALRWTDVLSGTLDARNEADVGFLFYGTIRDSSTDGYGAKGSDYMTGSLSLGQLTP